LWESYLARHFRVPLDHLHAPAMELEHVTDPVMQQRLAEATDEPSRDPHGRRVPRAEPGSS
jgi:Mn-dependent DtxR family transcriptional regulator